MEIVLDNKKSPVYIRSSHQNKRIQESVEAVVPDINDDIGRVVTVQPELYLKSKDLNGRGVFISGELKLAVMYLTEDESAVQCVNTVKQFSLEYELDELELDIVPHIKLRVLNAQAKTLNPRKLSISAEIEGELLCYKISEIVSSSSLDESCGAAVCIKSEDEEFLAVKAVCEKTFAINEQFTFPSSMYTPEKLVSRSVSYVITDIQPVSSKVLVKGTAIIAVTYLPVEGSCPQTAEFSTMFSQLIDAGQEGLDCCTAAIENTSAYFDLAESINGDKVLNAEIHAVIQLRCCKRQKVEYISDAYCCRMPLEAETICETIDYETEFRTQKISCAEHVGIAEDCTEVKCIIKRLESVSIQNNKLLAAVAIDIIYCKNDGLLSAVHRNMMLEADIELSSAEIVSAILGDTQFRVEDVMLDVQLALTVQLQRKEKLEIKRISAMELCEDRPYDLSTHPAISLVRVENESLWELAKKYKSRCDLIESLNDLSENTKGEFLLIPRAI